MGGEEVDPQGNRKPLPPQAALQMMGPVTQVRISAPPTITQTILAKGGVLPPPVDGIALIDTGAAGTCIDADVATKLSLPVTGSGSITSATHAAIPCNLHPIQVEVVGWPVKFHTNRAMGTSLKAHGIIALIGRDVLRNCILIYNGAAGTFSLSI